MVICSVFWVRVWVGHNWAHSNKLNSPRLCLHTVFRPCFDTQPQARANRRGVLPGREVGEGRVPATFAAAGRDGGCGRCSASARRWRASPRPSHCHCPPSHCHCPRHRCCGHRRHHCGGRYASLEVHLPDGHQPSGRGIDSRYGSHPASVAQNLAWRTACDSAGQTLGRLAVTSSSPLTPCLAARAERPCGPSRRQTSSCRASTGWCGVSLRLF